MLKINKMKKEKNVNNVGAILIARKPQRNTKTGVGADASVCPNPTKAYPNIRRGTGHRAQSTKTYLNHVGVGLDQPAAITLVALVITVIILIILAGVSLNLALGQNGIFQKSKQAVEKYKDEAQKEQNTLENIYQDMTAETGVENVKEDYSQLKIGDYVNNYPVYYDNVATKVNKDTGEDYNGGYYPDDKYANKWRIISIDEETNEVKLVSAGVPLNYYHFNDSSESMTALTTNFFSTNISCDKNDTERPTPTKYQFYQSGFKVNEENNKSYIKEICKVEELFKNNLTKIGTNGKPQVQSIKKGDDIDAVYKEIKGTDEVTSTDTSVKGEEFKDLLAIPCKDEQSNKYADTWVASAHGGQSLWIVTYR